MKARRTESGFLLVLDRGDEVIASLKEFADSERIGTASLCGIGAVRDVVLGYLDLEQKQYLRREMGAESLELLSLTGNIARLNAEPVAHCHVIVGDREMRTFGGHLFRAVVSVTAEITLQVYEGEVSRRFDEESGANLIAL
jgi:predicted DNA-binding protein with PD1-like motif